MPTPTAEVPPRVPPGPGPLQAPPPWDPPGTCNTATSQFGTAWDPPGRSETSPGSTRVPTGRTATPRAATTSPRPTLAGGGCIPTPPSTVPRPPGQDRIRAGLRRRQRLRQEDISTIMAGASVRSREPAQQRTEEVRILFNELNESFLRKKRANPGRDIGYFRELPT